MKDYYHVNIYLPLIDNVLTHLRDRFGPIQQKISNLSALISAYIGTYIQLQPAVELYRSPADIERVKTEFELWRTQWLSLPVQERKRINSAILSLQH